jgi:hypothetical protein
MAVPPHADDADGNQSPLPAQLHHQTHDRRPEQQEQTNQSRLPRHAYPTQLRYEGWDCRVALPPSTDETPVQRLPLRHDSCHEVVRERGTATPAGEFRRSLWHACRFTDCGHGQRWSIA